MPIAKPGKKGSRKIGRDTKKSASYKARNMREKNKKRRMDKRAKKLERRKRILEIRKGKS
jgi:hypothetical protein